VLPIGFAFFSAMVLLSRPWVPSAFPGLVGFTVLGIWLLLLPRGSSDADATNALTGLVLVSAVMAAFAVSLDLRQAPQRRAFRWLLLVLAGAALVAAFSGPLGSAGRMLRLLLWAGVDRGSAESIVFLVRNGVHLSFYCMVAYAMARAGGAAKDPRSIAIRTAILFTFFLASFDELNQMRTSTRGGSWWDVALDMVGASVGLLLASRAFKSP
jgi:VanZ family protein